RRVTDRWVGDQPRSAAALPRTRLFEPSENTAMFRPQAAIACSADQDCGAPRSSRVAMAFEISANASSPLSTYMNVPADAFPMATVLRRATSGIGTFDQRFSPRRMYRATPDALA